MLTRRRVLTSLSALTLAGVAARPVLADEPAVFAEDHFAIRGVDPVAYFREGAPVAGSMEYAVKWMRAYWQFSSTENLDAFIADPHAYAPKYGGYCAFALANNALASSDPEAWTIYEDRLYLCHNLDIRRRWQADIPGYVEKADANWPGVLKS